MNLNEIIKTRMAELGAEKQPTLIAEIEKRVEPVLLKKAAKLITKRMIKSAFAALLEKGESEKDPKQLKLEGID